jgi:hypothetical protein
MKNDYEFDYNDHPVCPHCKYVERDAWEWGDKETGETDCGSCCKPYGWTQHVSVTWSTHLIENKKPPKDL